MSLLSGLTKEMKTEERDSVGYSQLASNIYPMGIRMAYLDSNVNGTVSVKFEFEVMTDATTTPPTTRKMKHTEYISYAGGKFEKDGKTMRGLATVNGLCQTITGKDLLDLEREAKSIKVYEDQKEQFREKEVITDLIGEKLAAGIIHAIVDQQAKNNQSGKWEATGETREVNEFDKFFHPDTLQTSSELAKNAPAEFAETWKKKYVTGEAFNKAKGVAASGATNGAPAAAGNPAAASGGSLFN